MTELLIERPAPYVVVLRLNRPAARNALNASLRSALVDALESFDRDTTVRCLILAGDPRTFCAGADLTELQAQVGPIDMLLRDTERFWGAITRLRKPLIAAVRGRALGGGCELALHADIVVAGTVSSFGLPEVRVGLMPGAGGTQRLPRICGLPRAMLALLTGEPIDAEHAYRLGIVSALVDDPQLEQRAVAIASTIASRAPLAVRQIKDVARRGADCPLDAALALERSALQVLLASADRAEGVRAFLEKREPEFIGH